MHLDVPAGTAALEAELSFDTDALAFLGAASDSQGVLVQAAQHAATVKLAAVTLDPQAGTFALASFKVKGSAQPKLVRAQAYDLNGAPLAGTKHRLAYGDTDLSAGYEPARLRAQAVSTDAVTLAPSFANHPLGDLNQGGSVNVLDALDVLKISSGTLASPSDYQLYSADLDASNAVNILDALVVLQKATDVALEASLVVRPDALELDVNETGLLLFGNAGNQALNVTLTGLADVTLTKVAGLEGQSAAYEVTPSANAKSGLLKLAAGGAGSRNVTLLVDGSKVGLPTITLMTPTGGATLSGESVDLFWNITPLESDDHVHVYVDGEKKEGSVDPNNPYTLNFADKNVLPGERVIEVRVSDSLHNEYTNPEASDNITVTVAQAPEVGNVLYRVNAGGDELPAADGSTPTWSKDSGVAVGSADASPYYSAGDAKLYDGNAGSAYPGPVNRAPSLLASVPNALFTTERYDPNTGGEMQWEFPVAAGQTVEVRLFFAELFSGVDAAGERVFDVAIEGSVPAALNDIDPFATAGAKGAFMRSHTLTVTDGILNIDFLHDVIENPAVKGIEIVVSDGNTGNTAPQVQTIPNQTRAEGDAAELFVTATDVDNDTLTYGASGLPAGLDIEPTNGQIIGFVASGAANDSPYGVTISVSDGVATTQTSFMWTVTAASSNPAALIKVNSGGSLFVSTYGNDSFQISNTGDSAIKRVTIDASTTFLPDIVFDPIGKAGDSGAKCLTAGGVGNTATQVGLIYPANGGSDSADCVDPFSQPHNGINDEEGYDQLNLIFTNGDGFNPGETFTFGVDMDPTSIKGDQSTGDAGSISGFELVGATVTVEFASGEVTSSLWDEGSLGGSQVTVKPNAPATATIDVSGINLTNGRASVSDATQTISVKGPANATVSLLRADARLYIDAGSPDGGVGYDIDAFEANEVLAKELYTATLNSSGEGSVSVTLTQTTSPNAGPDAGLNHFIAVVKGNDNQTSSTSNVIVLDYTPDNPGGGSTSGAFTEQNGLVVIEMESGNVPSNWVSETAFSNFTGSSYLRYDGSNHFGNPGVDTVEYKVNISKTGTYRFQWRNAFGAGTDATEHNDSWLKIEASSFYGKKGSSIVCPKGYNSNENSCTGGVPEGAGGGGWFKVYRSGGSVGAWSWTANTSDNDAHQIFADFNAPGVYTILVSGRSAEHAVDRMVLYYSSVGTSAATNTSQSESPREP